MGIKTKKVEIPQDIYSSVEKRVQGVGFDSVQDYIIFVLQELINIEEEDSVFLTPEDEEAIKSKLRDLGYMD